MTMLRLSLTCVAALGLSACDGKSQSDPAPTKTTSKEPAKASQETKPPIVEPTPKRPPVPEDTAPTFESELARLDREIESNRDRADKQPNSFIIRGQLASKYLGRARLSGDWADYGKADAIVEEAFKIREGNGPWMVRARLNYTLHRLPRVKEDLDTIRATQMKTLKADGVIGLTVFEGEYAFQMGDYEAAQTKYAKALEMDEQHHGATISQAIYLWKTAKFEEADTLIEKARAQYHGKAAEPRAWLYLIQGLMDLDQGRYDDALAHYRDAEEELSGYWLIDEHIAEILTLTGKTEEAKKVYLDVIERTGNPEFLDAMAGILREEGKEDEAKAYIAKARAKYEEQLAQYPEAAYGHALGHFLEFGDDPKYTVELAEKNHTVRPNGEAKTLLAQAYLAAGDTKKAKKVIEQALKTPFSTADLHATAAEVYEKLGDAAKGKEQRDKALAINPKAFE